jgi:hypothetical protein
MDNDNNFGLGKITFENYPEYIMRLVKDKKSELEIKKLKEKVKQFSLFR